MSEFIIRPVTKRDAPQMLALYAPYVTDTTVSSEYVPPTLEEFRGRIETFTKLTPWLCCERGDEIVGYAYASPHRTRAGYQWSCETSIYTKKGFHRMGIASALYGALDELLTYQGYYSIYVGITCPNERSMSFHKSMGFEYMGVYRNSMFKFGEWRDVIWMGKSLRHHQGVPRPIIPYPQIPDPAFCQGVLEFYASRIHGAKA